MAETPRRGSRRPPRSRWKPPCWRWNEPSKRLNCFPRRPRASSLAEISRATHHQQGDRLDVCSRHWSMPGYVWRDDIAQRYHLTYRVSNLGLRQLQQSGLLGQCTSLLEDLAERTGELVRLAVVERGEKITWVYAVVGTRRTLRDRSEFQFRSQPAQPCDRQGLADDAHATTCHGAVETRRNGGADAAHQC